MPVAGGCLPAVDWYNPATARVSRERGAFCSPAPSPIVEGLEQAASRRVIIVVGSPPPPAKNPELFRMVFGEDSERVPSHVELLNVLWEMGIEPDVRMLPNPSTPTPLVQSREGAIAIAVSQIGGHQWANWPLGADLETRTRETVQAWFPDLFTQTENGFRSQWTEPRRDVLITWESRH